MKLEDVCTVFIDGDWIESKDQSNSGIRLIQTGNIGIGEYLEKDDKAKYVSEDTFESLKCTEVFPGDILISRLPEPVGRACIIPNKEERMITAVDCTICRPNEDIMLKEYLCYFMQSTAYYNQLINSLAGTTRKRISRKNLGKINIHIPNKNIQTKVITNLDLVTKIIRLKKEELSTYNDLIKSRFVEMFGDPVTNSQEWETMKLSELGELNRGVSKHRPRNAPELLNGPYPLVQTGDVANADTYITDYSSTYSEIGLKQSRMWSKGTLCITIAANIAKTGILTFDACFPDSVVGFVAGERTNQLYMHHWFSFFQKILEEQAPQSAQKNINLAILSNLSVMLPPIDLQNQFAELVQQVDKSKLAVQQSTKTLQTLKVKLMQDYFG